MGLDMYAFATAERIAAAVDFPEPKVTAELHYWRKHPDLHGWMQKLYVAKGGADEEFNLSPVVLDGADLAALEAAIKGDELPKTSGFFFGESDESMRDDDLAFVREARKAISDGKTVYYVAWW